MSMSLSDLKARTAKPANSPYELPNGLGLRLIVTPFRGRPWRWKYRFEGREKLMTFGACPEVSLARVRERHADGRRLEGIDPTAEKKAVKSAENEA
jgi:hypothetical protein